MNSIKPIVLSKVVEKDLCIGCGACVQACPSKALGVDWNSYGFLVATSNENQCDQDGACIQVCPFNPEPGNGYKNEDSLAVEFLAETPNHHSKIGRYYAIYAGYSNKHRATSSSGGIATFVFEKLFDRGLIDYVVTVGDSDNDTSHYQYKIISKKDDLLKTSKTRYHPVTLASALDAIKSMDGRVAISGVGCFIKAIRLAQEKDPALKEKIVFLVGIICGGVKSRFFTEYLAAKTGAAPDDFSNPEYRVKDPNSTAHDYGFSCTDNATKVTNIIKMREVGDMWGSGLFKANSCDYCDDVTTELADISLGDAWLQPYDQDGWGHNVIVSRSDIAEEILRLGSATGEIQLENLSLEKLLTSQQGSFNHRHDGLSIRIALAEKAGSKVPPKRPRSVILPLHLKLVQLARRNARLKSLQVWASTKNKVDFDKQMKPVLMTLNVLTKVSHTLKKVKKLSGIKP